MGTLEYLFAVVLFLTIVPGTEQAPRQKRNLWQLEELTEAALASSALTSYNGYGCYCGYGGAGVPVDGIDECCQTHDNCYGKVTEDIKGCSPKWDIYNYKVNRGKFGKRQELCLDNQNPRFEAVTQNRYYCQYRICQCDKALVDCWKKYPYPKTGKKTCPKQNS